MSIDLTFFTKLVASDLQSKLDFLQDKYPEIFPYHYVIYKARIVDKVGIEISNEFGLNPQSSFRMHVTNKLLVISTDEIADLVRKELGKENVIVLLNGEDLI
ncbi:hypothetical protein [Yersinia similis]|uniref:hypothetical protein n=1 Tax=Yersinia similis TaxID=367190 RepID=UPI0011A049A2|nr:hypothetical protein [Yersinia similis]